MSQYLKVPFNCYCEILALTCLGPKVCHHHQWLKEHFQDLVPSLLVGVEVYVNTVVIHFKLKIEKDGQVHKIVVVS